MSKENGLLLKAVAGSRLYGYASESSDYDFYEVYEDGWASLPPKTAILKSRQTIIDDIDVTQLSFSHFVDVARDGSHQALDAMFQAEPVFDRIKDFREGWRAGFNVVPAYERIITKFALQEGFRKQRHALRAAFNVEDILRYGRYAPELSESRLELLSSVPHLEAVEFRRELKLLSPIGLDHLL